MGHEDEKTRQTLALLIYLEARGEPIEGQIAVAWVVKNRVRKAQANPKLAPLFGSGWLSAMTRPKQFTCFNNGIPKAPNPSTSPVFVQCLWVADGVLNGWLENDPTRGADHYFAQDPPFWAETSSTGKTLHCRIGKHEFHGLYDSNGRKVDAPSQHG